eukprot:8829273-Pyramimonas_sp.AAC.1
MLEDLPDCFLEAAVLSLTRRQYPSSSADMEWYLAASSRKSGRPWPFRPAVSSATKTLHSPGARTFPARPNSQLKS